MCITDKIKGRRIVAYRIKDCGSSMMNSWGLIDWLHDISWTCNCFEGNVRCELFYHTNEHPKYSKESHLFYLAQ